MSVLSFGSDDEMREYLDKAARDAESRLSHEQRTITYGDYWVRFVNLVTREVEFGRVHTLGEIEHAERSHGATAEELHFAIEQTKVLLEQEHKMYGTSYIFWQPEGELGYTHKVNVWPIEESLFNAASEVGFKVDEMPMSAKINLEAAWQAFRGRQIGVQS